MTEDLPPTTSEPAQAEPPDHDRWSGSADRDARRAEIRAARHQRNEDWGRTGPLIGGVVLVLVGLLFLAQNFNLLNLGNWNWWALFILIPAGGAFASAWRQYQVTGSWSAAARGSLVGGSIILLVALIFLFNLDWGRLWPLFLILAGLGALLSRL